jgi:hypothetical protein
MSMAVAVTLSDALPRCFPLPAAVMVGTQTWKISVSDIKTRSGTVVLKLLLSGPYARFRRARIDVERAMLLDGGYDAGAAARLIAAWLPHSDGTDCLEIDAAEISGGSSPLGPIPPRDSGMSGAPPPEWP